MSSMVVANWAGNVVFGAERVASPRSVSELQDLVAAADRARAVGTGHSFSRVADTAGTLISLDKLLPVFEVTADGVRVGAGLTLGEVAERLHPFGLALHTLPSLPHLSVAGACATASHGSGDGAGSLASAVRAVELVTSDGALRRLARGDAEFDGVVVSFGSLGVVVGLELDVVPAFSVEQRVYQGLSWSVLVEGFAEVFASAYSVSVFTDWRGSCSAWVKRRMDDPPVDLAWSGARLASRALHPVSGLPAEHCTEQGTPGPWHERLPHFRAGFTPSVGAELQSEYLVGREHAADALRALASLGAEISAVLIIGEIRTVAADSGWLSPFCGRASVAIHFTWVPRAEAVRPVLALIEAVLEPWAVRPHWGKLFELAPEVLRTRYEHWSGFAELLTRLDPAGTFRNDVVDRYFSPGTAGLRHRDRRPPRPH